MAKSKITLKSLICNIGAMLMGALLIGSYFIPVFKTDLGLGVVNTSCSDIIANGGSDGGYTALAVMGLVAMILGCMLVLGSIVNLVIKVKNLDLCLIAISLLITLLAIVMLIIALIKIGGVVSLGFGVFAFLIAGVVASACTLLNRSRK